MSVPLLLLGASPYGMGRRRLGQLKLIKSSSRSGQVCLRPHIVPALTHAHIIALCTN
jgi:hypothetical protein